jgi:hypothetical protein
MLLFKFSNLFGVLYKRINIIIGINDNKGIIHDIFEKSRIINDE